MFRPWAGELASSLFLPSVLSHSGPYHCARVRPPCTLSVMADKFNARLSVGRSAARTFLRVRPWDVQTSCIPSSTTGMSESVY